MPRLLLLLQVQVTSFQENEGRKDLIEVTVMVETPSQRGIVIGAGGKALKRLGTTSRKDIEAFLGGRLAAATPAVPAAHSQPDAG